MGDFSEASGAAAMRTLLTRRPDIDAVFAASDPMALGALRALREADRSVPRRRRAWSASTTGRWPRSPRPPLTTVHQPLEQIGREMATMLLAQIGTGDDRSEQHLVLDTELVERASG